MTGKKLRILQLSPRYPFPADDGGKIGISNILKEFSRQGAEVTFFSFFDDDKNNVSPEAIEEGKRYADLKLYKHSTNNSVKRIIKSVVNNHSIYLDKHINTDIKQYIYELIKTKEFDIIHADHSCMGELALYAKSICNAPAGLRLHNIEWMIWKRYAENISKFNPKRYYLNKQAKLLKNAESELYSKMDVCFPITEPDKERARDIAPDGKYYISSAGVNTEEWEPDNNIYRNPNSLILATTYQWRHNIDAVKWFITNVMPELKKANDKIELNLIGKEQPEWLSKYKNIGINALGYVDKVQPYLNNASVYIAPLFVGSGVRIKILEAMAMELPVVATPLAAEGIKASIENGLLISPDKEKFVKNILMLTENPELAHELGMKAREYVMSEFSWEKNVGIMLKEYKRLANFE